MDIMLMLMLGVFLLLAWVNLLSDENIRTANPSFSFSAVDNGGGTVAAFECQHAGIENFTTCTSGKTYSGVGSGNHIFSARAIDSVGNVDNSPVVV